ncbi:hypothetical protein KP509_18G008200 [Ceratopteris richardii]|nr:hypothetical protein KP509_18G008200 [Ceratopteris richardii]
MGCPSEFSDVDKDVHDKAQQKRGRAATRKEANKQKSGKQKQRMEMPESHIMPSSERVQENRENIAEVSEFPLLHEHMNIKPMECSLEFTDVDKDVHDKAQPKRRRAAIKKETNKQKIEKLEQKMEMPVPYGTTSSDARDNDGSESCQFTDADKDVHDNAQQKRRRATTRKETNKQKIEKQEQKMEIPVAHRTTNSDARDNYGSDSCQMTIARDNHVSESCQFTDADKDVHDNAQQKRRRVTIRKETNKQKIGKQEQKMEMPVSHRKTNSDARDNDGSQSCQMTIVDGMTQALQVFHSGNMKPHGELSMEGCTREATSQVKDISSESDKMDGLSEKVHGITLPSVAEKKQHSVAQSKGRKRNTAQKYPLAEVQEDRENIVEDLEFPLLHDHMIDGKSMEGPSKFPIAEKQVHVKAQQKRRRAAQRNEANREAIDKPEQRMDVPMSLGTSNSEPMDTDVSVATTSDKVKGRQTNKTKRSLSETSQESNKKINASDSPCSQLVTNPNPLAQYFVEDIELSKETVLPVGDATCTVEPNKSFSQPLIRSAEALIQMPVEGAKDGNMAVLIESIDCRTQNKARTTAKRTLSRNDQQAKKLKTSDPCGSSLSVDVEAVMHEIYEGSAGAEDQGIDLGSNVESGAGTEANGTGSEDWSIVNKIESLTEMKRKEQIRRKRAMRFDALPVGFGLGISCWSPPPSNNQGLEQVTPVEVVDNQPCIEERDFAVDNSRNILSSMDSNMQTDHVHCLDSDMYKHVSVDGRKANAKKRKVGEGKKTKLLTETLLPSVAINAGTLDKENLEPSVGNQNSQVKTEAEQNLKTDGIIRTSRRRKQKT